MAFSLTDLISYLSGGGGGASPTATPLSQAMGAARAPEEMSRDPSLPPQRFQPNMSPINQAMMPQEAAMAAPAAAEEPGFLSKFFNNQDSNGNTAFIHAMRGLGAAGSRDPLKAMSQYNEQDVEGQKMRIARRKAMQPVVDQIAGTPFFQITHPDGRVETSSNPALAEFYKKQQETKLSDRIDGMRTQAVLNENVRKESEAFKGTVEAAGGPTSKPEFSPEVTRTLSKIDGILAKIPQVNTIDVPGVGKVQNPFVASIIDNTWGRVASTPDYETRRELDYYLKGDVLADIKRLGANPSEGDRKFMEKRVPQPDDPVARQLEYVQEMRQRLLESENRRVAAAQQRDSSRTTALPAVGANRPVDPVDAGIPPSGVPVTSPSSAAPDAPAPIATPSSKAAFDQLPKGTRFKAPDGKVYVK